MSKPKIGLVGYFGWGNFGDELFIETHKHFLSQDYDLEVVHDILSEPYFSEESLKKLDSYDGFLIGGGDLVNPNAVSSLYWRQEYLKKPVFIHGIGCPNLRVTKSRSINYFKEYFKSPQIKHICLRDIESKNYFDTTFEPLIKTVTYPDPVFALPLPPVKKNSQKKVMGVILRSHRSLMGDYEQVRRAVEEAKNIGYEVIIIVAAFGDLGKGDLEVSESFAQGEEIIYSNDLEKLCETLAGCDFILSMKFHALVVGTMYSVPVLQLSSTQKNRNLFRYLQRPDLQGNYQDDMLFRQIPVRPAPIHSLIVGKLKRDSREGYKILQSKMREVYY